MKSFISLIALCLCCFSAISASRNEQQIRNMLATQVAEWNKGNIAGYMAGYWENDSLVFIGRNGPTYGYSNTLARYKRSYPDAQTMGKLTSTILIIKKLSRKHYLVAGLWHLKREKGDLSGTYTLIVRKIRNQWMVVYDHSS